MFFRNLLLCAAMLFPCAMQAQVYECDLKTKSGNGGIQDKVFMEVKGGGKTVLVLDAMINHYNNKKAMEAKVKTNNAKRMTVQWTLKHVPDRANKRAHLVYRLTLLKASKKVVVSMSPLGFDNNHQARGRCAVLKG